MPFHNFFRPPPSPTLCWSCHHPAYPPAGIVTLLVADDAQPRGVSARERRSARSEFPVARRKRIAAVAVFGANPAIAPVGDEIHAVAFSFTPTGIDRVRLRVVD